MLPPVSLTPIQFLEGAKIALDQAGLYPWVTVALIVVIAMTVLTGVTD